MIRVLSVFALLLVLPHLAAQDSQPAFGLGIESQVYPTGIINAARADFDLSNNTSLNVRLAVNVFDRDDNGEHDDENGDGLGSSIGWRKYYGDYHTGWLWGLRADLWFLDVDWEDTEDRQASGISDVIVLQPTAEAGYRFDLTRGWTFTPTLAFGYEINVDTVGEDVGEGPILLAGVNLVYRWSPLASSRR